MNVGTVLKKKTYQQSHVLTASAKVLISQIFVSFLINILKFQFLIGCSYAAYEQSRGMWQMTSVSSPNPLCQVEA